MVTIKIQVGIITIHNIRAYSISQFAINFHFRRPHAFNLAAQCARQPMCSMLVCRQAFAGTRQITAMCQSSTSTRNDVYNKYIKYLVGAVRASLRPIYRHFPLRLSVCRGLIYINVHTVPSIRPIPCHWTYGRIARVSRSLALCTCLSPECHHIIEMASMAYMYKWKCLQR